MSVISNVKLISNGTENIYEISDAAARTRIGVLEPAAAASDIGKYLKAKSVSGGKVTEYEFGDAAVSQQAIEAAVDFWLGTNITNPDSPPLDRSLSSSAAAAPADMVGDIVDDVANVNDEIYTSTESVYDWSKNAASGFPYNWRPGRLASNGAIGSTNANYYLRNNKAVSFGDATTIRVTPPAGYYIQCINEYTSATIGTSDFVKNLIIRDAQTGQGVSFEFENVSGHYYGIAIGYFSNADSNQYYNVKTFTDTIVATLVTLKSRLDELEKKTTVFVSKTSANADFSTIKAAVEYANKNYGTTIVVDSGTYDIIEELGGSEYTENLSGLSSYAGGLTLGNNTKIIGVGSGAKLTAIYTAATNQVMTDRFSIFNVTGSFRLENLDFEVENVRYCVHEDMAALDAAVRPLCYTAEYVNCNMKHNGTSSETFNVAACIGGGTMNKSLHIIEGCMLVSPTGKNPAGYHNNATTNNGVARVKVRDNYFGGGTMTFTVFNSGTQVISAEVCGNSFPANIIDNSSGLYDVKAWNNVVR